jgi:uncharacterized ubiquitin-like protein YukD
MILVEVYVASMDAYYDFMLDETAKIQQVVGEIGEMLLKKTKSQTEKQEYEFMLCSMDHEEVLSEDQTLAGCRIKDGDRLLLV